MKLEQKIIIFVICIIVPTSVFLSFFLLTVFSNQIDTALSKNMEMDTKNIKNEMSLLITNTQKDFDFLSSSMQVTTHDTHIMDEHLLGLVDMIKQYQITSKEFVSISMYNKDGLKVYDTENYQVGIDNISAETFFQETINEKITVSKQVFVSESDQTILFTGPIRNNDGVIVGIMVGNMHPSRLYDTIIDAHQDELDTYFLTNDGHYLFSTERYAMLPAEVIEKAKSGVTFWKGTHSDGSQIVATMSIIPQTNWIIVNVISYEKGFESLLFASNFAIIMSIIVTFFSILGSIYLGRTISKPIKKLQQQTQELEIQTTENQNQNQNQNNGKYVKKGDEIQQLSSAFTKMREQILDTLNSNKTIQKEKDEFLSMLSHEMKTPLVPISGYCEMLSNPNLLGPLDSDKQDAVNEIKKNADLLLTLINDLLDLERFEMKSFSVHKTTFHISDMFNELLVQFQPLVVEKQIELFIDNCDHYVLHTDKKRLVQVFSNIILNAVDFLPKQNPRIEFGNKIQDNDIMFYVRDNGTGIPKEQLEYIFQKFYQIDKTLRRFHGGAGLGLSICKELISVLGGKIWVESTIDKGTTFYFTIPKNIEN